MTLEIITLAWFSIAGGWFLAKCGKRYGHAFCFAGSLLLTWEAMPTVDSQPRAVAGRLSAADRQPEAVNGPFVASSIKSKYHKPDCFYVRFMQHAKSFASEAEAIAAGCVPCRECIATALASTSPARPDSQAETKSAP